MPEALLQRLWYGGAGPAWLLLPLLLPLALIFSLLAALRRGLFRLRLIKSERLPVPVIVVGNINVGGSGKTPLVLWLVQLLREQGYQPGIVSRGYGGSLERPSLVTVESDPRVVGDEALLLARRAGVAVAVGADRPQAARLLLGQGVDVIISDDGLQHYRLARDIEIALIDGERRLGNRLPLPAGPLREPPRRLQQVDFVVCNGGEAGEGEVLMGLNPEGFENLQTGERRDPFDFIGRTVHAVAGIGNPGRFFDTLRALAIEPIEHPYPDHHPYAEGELRFDDRLHLIMTEKDGVKWQPFAGEQDWQLSVAAELPDGFVEHLLDRLKTIKR